MKVITESGTAYEFDGDKVRRVGGDSMRRDEDWLRFAFVYAPVVGEPMVMVLEPLGEGNATIRRTSPVVILDRTC